MENRELEYTEQLCLALKHLRSALGLLDASMAPAHIGAHVDLAINYLEDAMPGDVGEEGSNRYERRSPMIP